MDCPQCKNANEPEALFCAWCGTSLAAPEADAALAEAAPQPEDGGALRPRTATELVADTFRVYANNPAPFLVIAFLAQTPTLAAGVTPAPLSWLFAAAGFLFLMLAAGPMVHATAQVALAREVRLEVCFTRAWERVANLLVATVIVMLLIVASAILSLAIVGIPVLVYLIVVLYFYVQPIMLEGYQGVEALGRSRELVRGSWWRVFGIGLLLLLVIVAVTALISIPGFALAGLSENVGQFYFSAVAVVTMPIMPIGGTLMYFDLRVRKEGYTLAQLQADVGA